MTMEELAARLESVEKELSGYKEAAAYADDYRQVTNCMMRHIYGYYFHIEEEELNKYWAIDQEDVMYAHSNMAHYGYDSIYKYYVEGTNATKAKAREIGERVYGVKYEGNAAPGYRVVHILGSPYIEIAKDRKTAQGVWMSFSTMSRMNAIGVAEPTSVIQRFSGDFIRGEDGQWKVWHVRDYEDFHLDTGAIMPELRNGVARPDGPSPFDNLPYNDPEFRRANGVVPLKLSAEMVYQPWTVTTQEPHLPEPYDTWADTTPNIEVIDE